MDKSLFLRTAIAQINTTVGHLEGNTRKITDAIREAEKKESQFIAFPELAVTGYPPEDLLFKPQFVTENLHCLDEIVKSTGDIIAIVGFVDREDGQLFNAAAIIRNKRLVSVYRKILLPNYSVFDEKRYFESASKTTVFDFDTVRFGVSICEDIYQERSPVVNQCVRGRANLLFNISASPYYAGKRRVREELLRKLAKENHVPTVYANLVGGQDELLFDGYSLALDKNGEIVASAAQFQEEILYVDLKIRKWEKSDDIEQDRESDREMPEISIEIVSIPGNTRTLPEKNRLPAKKIRPMEPLEEIFHALCLGTREYVIKNGFQKVLIGLSGGIDSALVAVIAAEALGPQNVTTVTMPSVYSSEGSVNDSSLLAKNLSVPLLNIPIAPVVDSFDAALANHFKNTAPGLAEENLQARIRGTILMTLSNKFGWLVLTTGNKSETSVGYCTLYGDMAGGFAVIKDVYKTTAYELAKWINSTREKEIIPKAIIEKEPSAELRPDQKDSDSLPSYDVLDPILVKYVEENLVLREIVEKGFDRDLTKKIISLVDLNEYKRRQSPPGIKITPQAFGKDRRLPIVNCYKPE